MADNRNDSLEDKIANALAKALPAAVEVAVKAQAEINKQAKAEALAQAAGEIMKNGITNERCPECRQYRRACQGKHRLVAVFPSSGRFAKHWDGVGLNGVWYRSNHGGHKIPVPADFDIENKIAVWESEEEQLRTGRESLHDSGTIGLSSSNVNTNPVGPRG